MRSLSRGMMWAGGLVIVLLSAPRALACEPIYLPAFGSPVGCEPIEPPAPSALVATGRHPPTGDPASMSERSMTMPQSAQRPVALVPLYASFATLQALDAHSTIRASQVGGVERNPIVAPLVEKPMAVVALKAATTTGAILLTERLWRRHRVAAIALMIGVNAAYAGIVANNYRVRR
jgi:hypothetical protein